jgi:cell division septum initiation protein DivIVA
MEVAFFPQDTKAMKTAFGGVGIYRPTLKTDQGPAGNFGPFYVDTSVAESSLSARFNGEQGVAVLERFMQTQFAATDLSQATRGEIDDAISRVKELYARGEYVSADSAISDLRRISMAHGIETTRRAGVGRGEFFFCRPVSVEKSVVVGADHVREIETQTNELVTRIARKAAMVKTFVKKGASIAQAVREVEEDAEGISSFDPLQNILYFQPDVLFRSDGTIDIEKVNFPDLGMFMTKIDPGVQNAKLEEVQEINRGIRNRVLDRATEKLEGRQALLVTRDAVLVNDEDSLEHLELESLREGLQQRGVESETLSVSDLCGRSLSEDDAVLLMNVSATDPQFSNILQLAASDVADFFPDPFIKLFEAEATTYRRHLVTGESLRKFLDVIQPTAMDKPKGIYEKTRLIDKALRVGGTTEDIIYFSTPGMNGQQIPTFRYDPKSFAEVYKTIQKRQKDTGQSVDSLIVTPVPFTPEAAVVHADDGPRLAVFRFMFLVN